MNDDFLKHLRAEPPPAFASDLRKRLARLPRQKDVGNSEGELVMTTPNKLSTASHAASRRRTLVWGAVALCAAVAIFGLGAVLGRATPQPPATAASGASTGTAQQPAASASTAPAAAASAAFSTTLASADALAAIDLDALLTQDDLLPTGYAMLGRLSKRVPDVLRAVPNPLQVRAANLTLSGVSAGNITVLLYGSIEERDRAVQAIREAIAAGDVYVSAGDSPSPLPPLPEPDPLALAGEQSFSTEYAMTGSSIATSDQLIFSRCGVVVQVRLSSTKLEDDLQPTVVQVAQTLDQQLAPQVCQGQQVTVSASTSADAAAAAASATSTTPASADALAAVDLDALLTNDDLLPTGYAVLGQPGKRVPDTLRAVPEPTQVRAVNLTLSGVSAGSITVLLYGDGADREQAFQVLARRNVSNFVDQVYESDGGEAYPGFTFSPSPVANLGEQAVEQSAQSTTTNDLNAPTSAAYSTFTRCSAVVYVRLTSTTTRENLQPVATEIAQTLDQQLAPLVCQAP